MKLSAFLFLGALVPAGSSFADPATIDFTQQIFIDGSPVIDDIKCPIDKVGKRPCDTPLTLGELAFLMLERPVDHQDWTTALKHDELARAVRTSKSFPLLDDQRVMIQTATGPVVAPPLIGAVAKMLSEKK